MGLTYRQAPADGAAPMSLASFIDIAEMRKMAPAPWTTIGAEVAARCRGARHDIERFTAFVPDGHKVRVIVHIESVPDDWVVP